MKGSKKLEQIEECHLNTGNSIHEMILTTKLLWKTLQIQVIYLKSLSKWPLSLEIILNQIKPNLNESQTKVCNFSNWPHTPP